MWLFPFHLHATGAYFLSFSLCGWYHHHGSSTSLIQQLTTKLHIAFSLKQLGHLDYFLGLEIKYLPNNSKLMTQRKYIRDLLHKTHMVEAHSISSPMVSNCKLSQHGADIFHDPTLYRSVVGALQYATLTRHEKNLKVSQGYFVSWTTSSACSCYKTLGSSRVLWCWLGI